MDRALSGIMEAESKGGRGEVMHRLCTARALEVMCDASSHPGAGAALLLVQSVEMR